MSTPPADIERMISRHYRGLIRNGKIKAGSRLPSTSDLAAKWQTRTPVVQSAMSTLVREGLLLRRPGMGTVVLDLPDQLSRVGILVAAGLFTQVESAFLRLLTHELETRLCDRSYQSSIIVRNRSTDEASEPGERKLPDGLVEMANRREIQALVLPSSSSDDLQLLARLPIPISVMTEVDVPQRVSFDHVAANELALHALADQGCRSIAIIGGYGVLETSQPGLHARFSQLYVHAKHTAHDLGLALSDDCIITRPPNMASVGRSSETFGYQAVEKLMRQGLPDGLLVTEDVIAQGAMCALLNHGIDIPGRLKFVCHQNSGLHMLCPKPATFIEWDVAAIADALVDQVEEGYTGQTVVPRIVTPVRRDYQPNLPPLA